MVGLEMKNDEPWPWGTVMLLVLLKRSMHSRWWSRPWVFDGVGRIQDVMYHVVVEVPSRFIGFSVTVVRSMSISHRGRVVKAID